MHKGLVLTMCLALQAGGGGLVADAPHPCVAAYGRDLSKRTDTSEIMVLAGSLYKTLCQSSARSFSAGFSSEVKALVEGVPLVGQLMGSLGAKSNKSFCEGYEEQQLTIGGSTYVSSQPEVEALERMNECFAIFESRGVAVTHRNDHPASLIFSFDFHRTNIVFEVQGVMTTGGFSCVIPGERAFLGNGELNRTSNVEMHTTFSIACTRDANSSDPDRWYPEGTVTIGTNAGLAYGVRVADDTIFGRTRQSAAKAREESLLSQLAAGEQDQQYLQDQIRTARLASFPFFYGSTANRPWNMIGVSVDSYLMRKSESEYLPALKAKFCPDAQRAVVEMKHAVSGGCCGYRQAVLICSWADPVGDPLGRASLYP